MARPLPASADAVAIGRVVVSGPADLASVRAQLAALPTPSVEGWVFVRRLAVRVPARQLAAAVQDAIDGAAHGRAAQNGRDGRSIQPRGPTAAKAIVQRSGTAAAPFGPDPDRMAFADYSALATAFGRDALAGAVQSRWWWRSMALPEAAGAAVASFLALQPLRLWDALQAWSHAGLLGALWRAMQPADASHLGVALHQAFGLSFAMSDPGPDAPRDTVLPAALAPAVTFWRGAVSGAAPRSVQLAAAVSLLRWAPGVLLRPEAPGVAVALSMRLEREASQSDRQPTPPDRPGIPGEPAAQPRTNAPTVSPAAPPDLGTLVLRTDFGGALFLVNALDRVGLARRLAAWTDDLQAEPPPSGWRILSGLAALAGVPPDDLIARLFAAGGEPDRYRGQTDAPPAPHALAVALAAEIAELYRPFDLWPGLVRQPASLTATLVHFDLHLAAATADIAVRRAGLDLDPGWVPWLGRIIRFHYPAMKGHAAPRPR